MDLDALDGLVADIVRQFHPAQIILFGSHAWGSPTADSDVDLLLVMDTNEPVARCAARVSAAIDHPFPMDIVVRTPSTLLDACRRGGAFLSEIMKHGVVLYEARDQ